MPTFPFRTQFAEDIAVSKYLQGMTWLKKIYTLVEEVTGGILTPKEMEDLVYYIYHFKFIPAGRYLYYAGQKANYYNNCYGHKGLEDTREEWARLIHNMMLCLMCGGGTGTGYSVFRPEGSVLGRTGGIASGPIPLMYIANETGRNIIQGGSRRAALYADLEWDHGDAWKFLHAKDWSEEVKALKAEDFNFPAPLDMTNISVIYDDSFLKAYSDPNSEGMYARAFWEEHVKQALMGGEPGWSFNFGGNKDDSVRNACTEFTSSDDSDVCNLGSINFGAIESPSELERVVYLASKFLVCGGIRAELPYDKVVETREKNRRIGLGVMGVHEWLLKRGYKYEMNSEFDSWMRAYVYYSEKGANELSDRLDINRPKRYRAIAPCGTIGILASTTTGIEPLFATAYKRRYLTEGTKWKYQYVVDATAQRLIEEYRLNPDEIETAYSLSNDFERRIEFQAQIQRRYVDMAISSTVNLPSFSNQTFTPKEFSDVVLKYMKDLRGLTVYPDGSRGGQPLTEVPYDVAMANKDMVFDETEEKCAGGVCGL